MFVQSERIKCFANIKIRAIASVRAELSGNFQVQALKTPFLGVKIVKIWENSEKKIRGPPGVP